MFVVHFVLLPAGHMGDQAKCQIFAHGSRDTYVYLFVVFMFMLKGLWPIASKKNLGYTYM